jgi:translation initiation factor 5
MSTTVNIAAQSANNGIVDSFYRYKREKVSVQNINKNGGMTEIVNWNIICKQIKVDGKIVQKYLAKELGCPVDDAGKIRKKLTAEEIEVPLQKFIEKYVLCPKCKLPELNEKNICQSCGEKWKSK